MASSIVCSQIVASETRSGWYQGHEVAFKVINGLAIMEGDIVLGPVGEIEAGAPQAVSAEYSEGGIHPEAVGVTDPSKLWPKASAAGCAGPCAIVPYVLSNPNPPTTAMTQAIAQFNATFPNTIQFVPRQPADEAYVDFALRGDPNAAGSCGAQSFVGRIGRPQLIDGDACVPVSVILHEMGHAVGLYHEQSRLDRDDFINVQYNNITKAQWSQFRKQILSISVGLYDLGSTMQYGNYSLAKTPFDPGIETIPPGIPIREEGGYSAGDIDAIKRLYGVPPPSVTITSNPVGLQVIVDGQTVTTATPGATFAWTLGSQHTLDAPPGVQTLNGNTYVFGRWNDQAANAPANHTVTNAPGDNSPSRPRAAPAITVYGANFVQVVPFTPIQVTPANAGTVTAVPPPLNFVVNGTASTYTVANQAVTFTAIPSQGFSFYDWLPGAGNVFNPPQGTGANPLVTRPNLPVSLTARFASSPLTTVAANIPNLTVGVDGNPFVTPKNFALDYDPAWTAGSQHNLSIDAPTQSFDSKDSRYVFTAWSDNLPATHPITAAAAAIYAASFTGQFRVTATANGQGVCAGSVNFQATAAPLAPPQPTDGYYNAQTVLQFNGVAGDGFRFAGWAGDLQGTSTTPAPLTVVDEQDVKALFNDPAGADPLEIASFSPLSIAAGSPDTTVTINGSGLTNQTWACINGACTVATAASTTQAAFVISQNLLATPAILDITIFNSIITNGAECRVTANRPLTVTPGPTN